MKAITVLEATAEDAEVSTVPASLGPYVQLLSPSEIYVDTHKLRHNIRLPNAIYAKTQVTFYADKTGYNLRLQIELSL